MKFESFVGVDVSKLWVDICLISQEGEIVDVKCENDELSLKSTFSTLLKDYSLSKDSLLICAEYTGHYSNPLKVFCLKNNYNLWLESGAEIKLRSGVVRGKNDKVDALRIAQYAKRYDDHVKLQCLEEDVLEEMSFISSERDLYIRDRAKYKTQVKDLKGFINSKLYKDRKKRLEKHIAYLTQVIKQLDKQVNTLLEKNQLLHKQYKQLQTISGVGAKVALETIIATKGFTKFSNSRKYCCHIGVAPFSYQSGSSQQSRNKVSFRADKKLKTLYHMAALSAIKMNGELKEYFERKVNEGKNKMTVLNAVRAKLVSRMFAIIRDDRKYEYSYENKFV